ncbi:FG-GAP-like repeat-containing protein, partial [Acinetobacter baumannii]|nr:FG-GAP-like repeat-containing protein [Acinetobacter baumannii]
RIEDAAGNRGTESSAFSLTVDTAAPSATASIASYADNVDPQQGNFASGTTTNDTTPTLNITVTGTLGSGEVVAVYRDGVKVGNATLVSGSNYSYADSGLSSGTTYSYTTRIEDAAGNRGTESSAFSLTVDTAAPTQTVTISTYTDDVGASKGNFNSGTTTDDRNPVLNGSLNAVLDTGEQVAIFQAVGSATPTLLGYATVSGTSWTYEIATDLQHAQTYKFTAKVIDAAGNIGPTSSEFTITEQLIVTVNTQSTLDTTPIVSGAVGFNIKPDEYLDVTVNGTTYSSQDGKVVIDPDNNTWYVQIPTALTKGATYQVNAVLKKADGTQIVSDTSSNELVIGNDPAAPTIPPSTDAANKATALTIGENGMWRLFSNMTLLDANGTNSSTIGSFATKTLKGNQGVLGAATFIDFDRDGDMDLFGSDSQYNDGQQAFENKGSSYTQTGLAGNTNVTGNTGYYAFQVGSVGHNDGGSRVDYSGTGNNSANAWTWYGGTAAYDKIGDGYVDLVYGDNTPNDETGGQGRDTSFILNTGSGLKGATTPNFEKDPALVDDAAAGSIESGQATPEKLISTVDLNNDGAVDIVFQGNAGTNKISNTATQTYTGTTGDANRLVVISNDGTNSTSATAGLQVTQIIENTLYNDEGLTFDGLSMTWADFNGDGYMDLFQGTTDGANATAQNNSKIFYNDGTGKLAALTPNATSGISSGYVTNDSSKTYIFSDDMKGGGSVAVDWNGDGKMDIIEIPYYTGANLANGAAQNVLLFTNTTSSGVNGFTQSTLINIPGTSATADQITGLLTLDLNWDGAKDAIFFTGNAGATLVTNTNSIANGTSIHLRILDQNGINALYGNTVKLYNSAGQLVGTQIINPQSGNQTSDSSAIVDFYGLNANESYTAVLLRNIGGVSQDVGGVSSIGGYSIENVNAAWTGLKAGAATSAFVLTAESGTASNDANKIGNDGLGGIVGTGYNDTFFATLGNDVYQGGGGTTIVSGERVWSNTGGIDIVDYKLAGSAAITVDLSNTAAQNTGFGTATFKNIEGIAGGSGNDTFTGNSVNNYFEGRGGNDTFNLASGGQDTLIYKLLDSANATGGNGHDTVNGFFVGTVEATSNADIINVKDLLVGYTADADGAAHYINGTATLDSGETIGNYLKVTVTGGNTVLSIDRDGAANGSSYTDLITLNNVDTTLEKLLANHQIIIG